MPDRLLVRLTADGDFSWLKVAADGRGAQVVQSGAPPAAVQAAAGEIVVLVAAEEVLLTHTQLTARNRAQRVQAVPFAVEDQLLGAVEDMHFAISDAADATLGIAVVAKTRMREWLGRLVDARIRADVLVPESLAMPCVGESASVLVEQDRVLTRFSTWSAFVCARIDFPAWLEQARLAGDTRRVDLFDADRPSTFELLDGVHVHSLPTGDALAWFGANLGVPAINLLCGEFAAAHRQARGTRWWRRAAALAAAALMLAFVHRGVEVVQSSRALAVIETSMLESVQRTFADLGAAERARDPASVMRARLERLRGGTETTGFLRMLGQIAPIVGTTTRTQLRGLEYRSDTLEINLRAADVQTLDSMRERIAATPGLTAELTATNPVENGTDGRIRIQGVAP
ncbi:MAG: type II secretion system protein GspL [Dokdonella sp.]